MFNKVKIETDLYGIVGLRQPYNPDYQILDVDNEGSTSGYFATDNPYVKVEYLKDSQDFDGISDADFNEQLKQIQQSSIASVCNAVFNDSDYIDRQVLFPHAQNRINTETLPHGFICHKIEVSIEKNIAFEITRVLLDFEGTGKVDLMLFNTSQSTPIYSTIIDVTSGYHTVENLNWVIDNSGNTYKGEYYIGYISNDPNFGTLKPYKRDYNNSNIQSCITHLNINQYYFEGVVPLGLQYDVPFPLGVSTLLPDLTTEQSLSECTGLNFDITVYDDFTDLILNNKQLFGYAIYLDFAIKLISIYTASLRSNRNQRISEAQVIRMLQEIEGQDTVGTVRISGLRPQLIGELKRLTNQVRKIKEGYFGGRAIVQTQM